MKLLSKSNSKLKKENIMSFGLPAAYTCPGAGACKEYCYARKGCYRFGSVQAVQMARLEITKQADFTDLICNELNKLNKKPVAIRIHDSGDFYNQAYLDKWIRIAELNPNITFYAYTKSVMLDFSKRPANFLTIGSYGSIDDDKINLGFFSKQFNTTAIVGQGMPYMADCSDSDLKAIKAAIERVTIVLQPH